MRRPIEHMARRIKAGAMTGAVPAFLRGIPKDMAWPALPLCKHVVSSAHLDGAASS